jgi:hypothetical protein
MGSVSDSRFRRSVAPIVAFLAPLGLTIILGITLNANAWAAPILDVQGGQLMGASGVDVGGTLYDVEFRDGTCIELFAGCDSAEDFLVLASEGEAGMAAQALLDQVLVDGPSGSFDSFPEFTNGLGDGENFLHSGRILTVYWSENILSADGFVTDNGDGISMFDEVRGPDLGLNLILDWDTADEPGYVYAVWSTHVVPEPSTTLLVAIGLTGLAVRRRRLH